MDDDYNNDGQSKDSNDYNGKIMFASGAVLVLACIVIVLFHAFVRWSRHRNANNHPPPHHQSRALRRHVILISGVPEGGGGGGLDLRVLKSIPTFTYKSKTQEKTPPLECAVCLSEFEDGDIGRVLPGCSHRFHVGCIDVWLGTHSDCPLCRAQVRTDRVNILIDDRDVGEDEAGRDETDHDPGSRIDPDRSSSSSSSSSSSTPSHDRTVADEQDHHYDLTMKTEGSVSGNDVAVLDIESGGNEGCLVNAVV